MIIHLISLAFAWAWGVVAGSLGLNALIKSNQEKSALKAAVAAIAPAVHLTIDTNDAFSTGTSATAAATFVSVVALLFATHVVRRKFPSSSIFRFEAAVFVFCAIWLIASMIPFTLFFATRSAHITAKIGNVSLPQQVIEQTQQKLGATPVYNKKGYLRLFAILPWITVLATCFAAFTSFLAAEDVDVHNSSTPVSKQAADWPTAEKGRGEQNGMRAEH